MGRLRWRGERNWDGYIRFGHLLYRDARYPGASAHRVPDQGRELFPREIGIALC